MGKHYNKILQLHKSYGELIDLACPVDVPYNVILALFAVESSGNPFGPENRPIIRFEVHQFWTRWGKRNEALFNNNFSFRRDADTWTKHKYLNAQGLWVDLHTTGGGQVLEWDALNTCERIGGEEAYEYGCQSISMGLGQLMGFHCAKLGYPRAADMLLAQYTVGNQIADFVKFISLDPAMLTALKAKDWQSIARLYNGSGQVATYSVWLKAAYDDACLVNS